jgi:hypothetical protein
LWLLSCASAWAWGPDGHRIVARIAEDRLTAKARAGVTALLAPGQSLADNYVCNWPDYIRDDQPETGPWHYVDIPYDAVAYNAARDCTNGACVVAQVIRCERSIATPAKSATRRSRALKFFVHFVGDMHQPLHCISRDDDAGGNLRTVIYPGDPKESNLHAIWDANLVLANLGTNSWRAYADTLNGRITPAEAAAWSLGTPADWANESHAIAVNVTYKGVPPTGGPPFEPDKAYIAAGRRVVDEQLMKAGVRLAALLNRAFR